MFKDSRANYNRHRDFRTLEVATGTISGRKGLEVLSDVTVAQMESMVAVRLRRNHVILPKKYDPRTATAVLMLQPGELSRQAVLPEVSYGEVVTAESIARRAGVLA